jgi:hypothetical protein
MSHVNSTSVAREAIFNSPQQSFLGILEQQSQVERFRKALFNLGIPPKAVSILTDASALRVAEGENLARKLLSYDEIDTERRFSAALKNGKKVIAVRVPEDDQALRASVADAFYAAEGTFLTYFGSLTFEQIPKPGASSE